MRAVVLAAGRGSRLAGHTRSRPKCLVELAGRSLLQWQLAALSAAGIERVTVVRGYRKELLAGPGYDTLDNNEWASTNMVRSLCRAESLLRRGPCLVAYADIVYHPDHVRALCAASGGLTIAYDRSWESLWRLRFEDPMIDAETLRVKDHRITEIGGHPRSLEEVEGQYMGLLRFTPEGWSNVKTILASMSEDAVDALDMTSLLRRCLKRYTVQAVGVDGKWCEVDTDRDLQAYSGRMNAAERWEHDWRW